MIDAARCRRSRNARRRDRAGSPRRQPDRRHRRQPRSARPDLDGRSPWRTPKHEFGRRFEAAGAQPPRVRAASRRVMTEALAQSGCPGQAKTARRGSSASVINPAPDAKAIKVLRSCRRTSGITMPRHGDGRTSPPPNRSAQLAICVNWSASHRPNGSARTKLARPPGICRGPARGAIGRRVGTVGGASRATSASFARRPAGASRIVSDFPAPTVSAKSHRIAISADGSADGVVVPHQRGPS